MNKKKIKVVYRKLGREGDWGRAFFNKNKIEVEQRTRGKMKMRIVIHETLHILFPELPEYKIRKSEKIMSDVLWSENYRCVDNKIK